MVSRIANPEQSLILRRMARIMRKVGLAILFFTIGAASALAADFNGKWTADVNGPRRSQNLIFNFHIEGSVLTGTIATPRGDIPITDGKVDGDTITFTQVTSGNNEVKLTYTGKADGDAIKFSRQRGERPPVEFTAKRISATSGPSPQVQ